MNKINLEFKWTVSRGRETYGYNINTLYADGIKVARCNGGGYDMEGTNLGTYLESHFADRLLKLTPNQMPEQSHWQPERAGVCADKCWEKWKVEFYADRPIENMPKLPDDCFTCPVCQGSTRPSREGKTVSDGHYFSGLVFVDPKYNPLKATLTRCDDTFTKPEDVGKTFGQLQKEGKIVDLEVIRTWYKNTSHHPTARHTVPSIDGACGMNSVMKIGNAIGLTFEYVPVRSKKLDVYIMHVDAIKQEVAA